MRGKKVSKEISLGTLLLPFGCVSSLAPSLPSVWWDFTDGLPPVFLLSFMCRDLSHSNSDLRIPSVVGSSCHFFSLSSNSCLLWTQFSSFPGPLPSLAAILSSPSILEHRLDCAGGNAETRFWELLFFRLIWRKWHAPQWLVPQPLSDQMHTLVEGNDTALNGETKSPKAKIT